MTLTDKGLVWARAGPPLAKTWLTLAFPSMPIWLMSLSVLHVVKTAWNGKLDFLTTYMSLHFTFCDPCGKYFLNSICSESFHIKNPKCQLQVTQSQANFKLKNSWISWKTFQKQLKNGFWRLCHFFKVEIQGRGHPSFATSPYKILFFGVEKKSMEIWSIEVLLS